ncbi:Holliday junction resolvase RuvX [Aeromicrobium sp. S22]|uniref:Holliday junction resolvase RuvX n=1 Tax=Aeromicrobium sp. S22 TaxID=2662029 RepID=UPI002816929B|nr:Holliday junction resolvase RuvX [Aeromicrobium sp. S22]
MDVGDVRIGIAVSDPDGILATPVETVAAGPGAIPRIAELVAELDVLECVVGLPMGLSGREGPAATKVRAFCAELLPAISPVPIRLFDERMTTTSAHSLLRQGGRSSRTTRGIIDQAAATVILQTALDSERTRGSAPGEST